MAASSGAGGVQGWLESVPQLQYPKEQGKGKAGLKSSDTKRANKWEPHSACYFGVKANFSRLLMAGRHP